MKIVYGKAVKGGSPTRRDTILDLAIKDLELKIGKSPVSALEVHEDDAALYVIASVNGIEEGKKEDKDLPKKGGK